MPAPWGGAVGGAAESVSLLTLLLFLPETTQRNVNSCTTISYCTCTKTSHSHSLFTDCTHYTYTQTQFPHIVSLAQSRPPSSLHFTWTSCIHSLCLTSTQFHLQLLNLKGQCFNSEPPLLFLMTQCVLHISFKCTM